MKLKPIDGDHVVVYQTSDSNIQLMEDLKILMKILLFMGL